MVLSSRVQDALDKAYARQVKAARDAMNKPGSKGQVAREKLAQLLVARMCLHELRAWNYNKYVYVRCDYCRFTFSMDQK